MYFHQLWKSSFVNNITIRQCNWLWTSNIYFNNVKVLLNKFFNFWIWKMLLYCRLTIRASLLVEEKYQKNFFSFNASSISRSISKKLSLNQYGICADFPKSSLSTHLMSFVLCWALTSVLMCIRDTYVIYKL